MIKTLADLIAEEEVIRMAEAKAEMALEDAAWLSLTNEQRAAAIEQRTAYWQDLENRLGADGEDDEEE